MVDKAKCNNVSEGVSLRHLFNHREADNLWFGWISSLYTGTVF